jgi:hypothetical protein
MKMPTLLATANQKLSAFVRRRAFSERSRWLAVFFVRLRRICLMQSVCEYPPMRSRWSGVFSCGFAAFFIGLQSAFRTILNVKASLAHLLHAQAVPAREKAPERELLSVSKGRAFGN